MAVEAYLPALGTIVAAAAIDSINPCAIGVLILMVSVLIAAHKSVKKMLLIGMAYITSIFVVYLLAGLGLIYFFSAIPLFVAEYISIVIGTIIIFAGLLEIKDFFWYGRWFSLGIPPQFAKIIHDRSSNTAMASVIFLGAFVAAVELPCTGAPYLAVITLLSQYFDFTAFMLLVLYNIIFVLPLILILVAVAMGMNIAKFKKWKQEGRGTMRLAIGLMLIAMGWLLILIANGTVNLG